MSNTKEFTIKQLINMSDDEFEDKLFQGSTKARKERKSNFRITDIFDNEYFTIKTWTWNKETLVWDANFSRIAQRIDTPEHYKDIYELWKKTIGTDDHKILEKPGNLRFIEPILSLMNQQGLFKYVFHAPHARLSIDKQKRVNEVFRTTVALVAKELWRTHMGKLRNLVKEYKQHGEY